MSLLTPDLVPDDGAVATVLRTASGDVTDGRRWTAPLEPADHAALDRCLPPVLDVGCGPARHTLALAHRGLPALGVDITGVALDWARPRGALVLQRSVFDRMPGTGRWGSVLLLDGNVGIGGDPVALLTRVAELLRDDGVVVVELDPPAGDSTPTLARLEVAGATGPWFDWTRVGRGLLVACAGAAGLRMGDEWQAGDRSFAVLHRTTP